VLNQLLVLRLFSPYFAGRSTSVETKRLYQSEFNGDRSDSLGAITKG